MAKITTPDSLYGNSRDILREAERENEILADIAGEEYESPGDIPKGKYVIEKRLLDAAQKKNELLESIAEGGGTGGGAAKAIGIDYATDVISLKNKDGDVIAGSGATLPAYGVSFDPTTGGLTLTKNGTAVSGQTVTIPNYGSPVGVTDSSDMVDEGTIYLYEGTTGGGFTNGHFYYYDGSAWADGGEYAAATVQTDKTLLVEDRAADAKATGEAVGELKTQISNIDAIFNTQKSVSQNPAIINEANAHIYNTASSGNVLISGKNICVVEDFDQDYTTSGGTLNVKAQSGIITINGTSSSSNIQVSLMSSEYVIPAGTKITMSTNNTVITYNFCNRGIQSGNTRTFETTAASNACNASRNFINIPGGTYDNVELHLQAEIGETATTFEPFDGFVYAGGDTSFDFEGTAVVIGATNTQYYVPKQLSTSFVNVRDIGAVGDGTIDDSDALQSAITMHRKVYIPSGLYIINKTLTIPSDTEIMGDGDSTIIQLGDNPDLTPYEWSTLYDEDNYFYPYFVADQSNHVYIHDLFVQGNLTTEDEHIHTGICFYNCEGCTALRVKTNKINYFPANSLPRPSGQWRRGWGLSMFDSTNIIVRDGEFTYSPYENVRIGKNCRHIVVDNCVIKYGWRTGLQILRGCDDVVVSNCRITQDDFNAYDTEACITLHSGQDAYISNVLIKDCILSGKIYEPGTGSGNAISFIDSYTDHIIIDGCIIAATGTSNGIYAAGKNVSVKNCEITCDGNGIIYTSLYDTGSVVTVCCNKIRCPGLGVYIAGNAKIDYGEIRENQINSGENHGCYIENAGATRCSIVGNNIKASLTKNCVHFTATTTPTGCVITSNNFVIGQNGVKVTNAEKNIIALNDCIGCTSVTNADQTTNIVDNNMQ